MRALCRAGRVARHSARTVWCGRDSRCRHVPVATGPWCCAAGRCRCRHVPCRSPRSVCSTDRCPSGAVRRGVLTLLFDALSILMSAFPIPLHTLVHGNGKPPSIAVSVVKVSNYCSVQVCEILVVGALHVAGTWGCARSVGRYCCDIAPHDCAEALWRRSVVQRRSTCGCGMFVWSGSAPHCGEVRVCGRGVERYCST